MSTAVNTGDGRAVHGGFVCTHCNRESLDFPAL